MHAQTHRHQHRATTKKTQTNNLPHTTPVPLSLSSHELRRGNRSKREEGSPARPESSKIIKDVSGRGWLSHAPVGVEHHLPVRGVLAKDFHPGASDEVRIPMRVRGATHAQRNPRRVSGATHEMRICRCDSATHALRIPMRVKGATQEM